MKIGKVYAMVCLSATFTLPASAGVWIRSPTTGATSASPVHFVANASSPACSNGVAAMGIYTAPYVLAYTVHNDDESEYVASRVICPSQPEHWC